MHSHLTLHQHLTVEENRGRQTLHQQLINQFESGGGDPNETGALEEEDEQSSGNNSGHDVVAADDSDDDQKLDAIESQQDARFESHAFSVYTDSLRNCLSSICKPDA